MLNYETLLSSYDDKLTLMQWLKKVEAALKDASAVSFNVNKRGDATLTFSVVFEDGSEIESNEIILQQGESVQAATIRNGHLILTLTNGDELDAGDLGGVSSFSIDASQHLIVTYQNGTTQDLGAIFSGNVVINGNFEVTGLAKLPSIEGDENGNINVDGDIVISDGGISIADGAVSTPILTSANDHIEAQKPVIEVMNDYVFISSSGESSESKLDIKYAGACKNGNKLTLAVFFEFTRKDTIVGNNSRLTFAIPYSVWEKLFPFTITGLSVLQVGEIYAANEYNAGVNIPYNISKEYINTAPYYRVNMSFYKLNERLTLNTPYYIRLEITFLLSDNLAA